MDVKHHVYVLVVWRRPCRWCRAARPLTHTGSPRLISLSVRGFKIVCAIITFESYMLEGYWIADYTECGYTHDFPPVDVYTYDAWCVQRVSAPYDEESVPTWRVRSAHSPGGCENPHPTVSTPAQLTWSKCRLGRGRCWQRRTRFPWLSCVPFRCPRYWRVLAPIGNVPPCCGWSAGVT